MYSMMHDFSMLVTTVRIFEEALSYFGMIQFTVSSKETKWNPKKQ